MQHHPATQDLENEQDKTNRNERALGMDEKLCETNEWVCSPYPPKDDISSEEDDECPICLTSLDKMRGEKVALPCCHMFCYTCITNWLEHKRICPTCKTNVDEEKLCYGLLLDEKEREGSLISNAPKKRRKSVKKKKMRKKKEKRKSRKRAVKRSSGRGSEKDGRNISSSWRAGMPRRRRSKRKRDLSSSSRDYRRKLRCSENDGSNIRSRRRISLPRRRRSKRKHESSSSRDYRRKPRDTEKDGSNISSRRRTGVPRSTRSKRKRELSSPREYQRKLSQRPWY